MFFGALSRPACGNDKVVPYSPCKVKCSHYKIRSLCPKARDQVKNDKERTEYQVKISGFAEASSFSRDPGDLNASCRQSRPQHKTGNYQ